MKKKEKRIQKKPDEVHYFDQYKEFDVSHIGEFITNIRKQRGLSQNDIANALYIDKRKVSRWETGKSIPETEIIPKLANLLNVSIIELYASQEYSQSFMEKFEFKIKNPKTILKIKIHHKILFIIGILFGIFLGLCAFYTITNYNTVEVYSLKSLNNDFNIKGNYIKYPNNQILNITSLKYIGIQKNDLDINVYNVTYNILINNRQIIQMANTKVLLFNQPQIANLLTSINTSSLTYEKSFKIIDEDDILALQINYRDSNSQIKNIIVPFKLNSRYKNN